MYKLYEAASRLLQCVASATEARRGRRPVGDTTAVVQDLLSGPAYVFLDHLGSCADHGMCCRWALQYSTRGLKQNHAGLASRLPRTIFEERSAKFATVSALER